MQTRTIQPERLVEELQRAKIPRTRPRSRVLAIGFSVLNKLLPSRIGIPHGVGDLAVRAGNVYIDPLRNEVAFCFSRNYQALGSVPKPDGQPYPNSGTARTEVMCHVPLPGYYDVVMKVSVNGAVTTKIESATPVAV